MSSSFFKQKRLSCKTYTLFTWYLVLMFTIVCPISKCPKIQQDKNLSSFDKLRCQNNGNFKIYDFLQKLKKVVRISFHIIMIITGMVILSNCLRISFLLKRHNLSITDLFFKTLEEKVVMLFL